MLLLPTSALARLKSQIQDVKALVPKPKNQKNGNTSTIGSTSEPNGPVGNMPLRRSDETKKQSAPASTERHRGRSLQSSANWPKYYKMRNSNRKVILERFPKKVNGYPKRANLSTFLLARELDFGINLSKVKLRYGVTLPLTYHCF